MIVHEYRCRKCKTSGDYPPGTEPHYCCGGFLMKRVWSVGVVWPRAKRGH